MTLDAVCALARVRSWRINVEVDDPDLVLHPEGLVSLEVAAFASAHKASIMRHLTLRLPCIKGSVGT